MAVICGNPVELGGGIAVAYCTRELDKQGKHKGDCFSPLKIQYEIQVEAQRARQIHKPWPVQDIDRCIALLTEELGEASKEALALGRDLTKDQRKATAIALRKELIQLAAATTIWLEEMEKVNGYKPD